jgi:replicative DNA helicase
MDFSKELLEIFNSPSKWARTFLKDPNDITKLFVPRSYQDEILQVSRQQRRIILRWGRRLGKTVVMCADILWWAEAYPLIRMIENKEPRVRPFTIRIYTPRDKQIKELWEGFTQLIGDSELLKSQLIRIRRGTDDSLIEFENGSKIYGQTVGVGSQNSGVSLRGQSGDLIYVDEMDWIPREIMESVIMPIWTTHAECILRIASTPSGKRDLFWLWSTKAEELGWFHSHHPSWHSDNTDWVSISDARKRGLPITESTEFQIKAITSSENYTREYDAEFGEEFGGVYKHTLINKNLVKYNRSTDMSNPDVFNPGFQQNPENLYVLGVDWNSYIHGGQIVLLEYCCSPTSVRYFDDSQDRDVTIDFTNKYRLFYRIGIKSKEATQRNTRLEIIRLMTNMKIDFVYVDYGAGDTNIEELTHYGKDNPDLKMNEKLRVIDSGAVIEHWDPVLREKVKKRNKSMMVNFSVLSLEEGFLLLPQEEDQKTRLVGQMRSYLVKNITTRGDFSYSGDDHILDAFNLAIYGFQKEFGDLLKTKFHFRIMSIPDPRRENYPIREMEPKVVINSKNYSSIRDPEKTINFTPFRLHTRKLGSQSGIFKTSRNIF